MNNVATLFGLLIGVGVVCANGTMKASGRRKGKLPLYPSAVFKTYLRFMTAIPLRRLDEVILVYYVHHYSILLTLVVSSSLVISSLDIYKTPILVFRTVG